MYHTYIFSYTIPAGHTRHRQVEYRDLEDAKRDMHSWVMLYCPHGTTWSYAGRE